MIGRALAVAIVGFCLIAPAVAYEATPDDDDGRYSFSKVPEGFLRLDSRTGEVSVCGRRTVGWACQAVPEDRAVLEGEIARLRRDNAALKKEILSHGLPLPGGATPESDVARPPSLGANSDFDRVVAFVGRVWHRFVEAIAQAQKQVLNKS